MNTKQTITINVPESPTAPALVEFSPGPLTKEAIRLSEIPGSGWRRVSVGGTELDQFLVDRKVILPKAVRKGRPDASSRMSAYNKAKPSKPAPQPAKDPSLWPSEEELEAESRRADAAIEAERRKKAAKPPVEMLPDPEDPEDFDY